MEVRCHWVCLFSDSGCQTGVPIFVQLFKLLFKLIKVRPLQETDSVILAVNNGGSLLDHRKENLLSESLGVV